MAATRKSDFSGDVYGDWTVTGRAPAQDKKRSWFVHNGKTDETKTVLQTDLTALVDESPTVAGFVAGIHQVPLNPFDPVFAGSLFSDLADLDVVLDHDDDDVINERRYVGPGDCKHGIFINDCPECGALLGDELPARPASPPPVATYVPQGENALSAQIARAARAGVLTAPIEIAQGSLPPGEVDWTADLATDVKYEVVEHAAGLGEAAEDEVSEATLDERAAKVPQNPTRAAIRDLMSAVHDVREELQVLQADVQVRLVAISNGLAVVMDKVDATLKASLTQ